jgi:AAA+ superfamily predicted ATPase
MYQSDNAQDICEQANNIVDAVLAYISRLNNIPILKLIEKGNTMITYKDKPIQITADIFLKVDSITFSPSGTNITMIKISLLSNTLSTAEIVSFVKDIYANFVQEMQNSLGSKIYYFDQKNTTNSSLPSFPSEGVKGTSANDLMLNHKRMLINSAPKQLSFSLAPFYSNKQFSNIFGKEVRMIEKRVRFFMENKSWYDERGIPYQLGLLLSGIPGSGKSSCIKAIANLTGRHIVNVNFANITTATQLKNLFYSDHIQVISTETMSNTQSYFIPIEKRLYVLEELDAIGDIVKQRDPSLLHSTAKSTVNDEVTLMEILTILDGTQEISNRMYIMTSNYPEMLDTSLIRAGRVDLLVKFGFANKDLIAEMFRSYFEHEFPSNKLYQLPDKMLSAAEVSQVLFRHFDDCDIDEVIKDLNRTAQVKNKGNALHEIELMHNNDNSKGENALGIDDALSGNKPIGVSNQSGLSGDANPSGLALVNNQSSSRGEIVLGEVDANSGQDELDAISEAVKKTKYDKLPMFMMQDQLRPSNDHDEYNRSTIAHVYGSLKSELEAYVNTPTIGFEVLM